MVNMTPDFMAILPMVVIMLTGMIVLLGDSCVPGWRQTKSLSAIVSLIGVFIAAFFSIKGMGSSSPVFAFSGAVIMDAFANACGFILLIAAALAILLAMTYLENRRLNLGEYYVLVLFSTSGSMLMAAAGDLIVLFVAVEILSVALYVLAGFARTEERSDEAALKYFLLGAFAAGFLLYGIALIYGGSANAVPGGGTTNLTQLAAFLRITGAPSVMLLTGIALLFVGLSFKAALVPFHQWTPDVYEGAPTSVTAYMAAGAKIAAFAAFLRVCNALIPISQYWLLAIQALAVLTMFGGNILAVTQDNVKRMLAYSSIAHAGYLLVGVSAITGEASHSAAFGAMTFYLLAYTLMTMGAFGILIYLSRKGKDCQTLTDLKGLGRTEPMAAYMMLVFMLSLGGIPPTMGFMGKWFLFNATLMAGQLWLAVALGCASIISIYYYLKVIWMMFFQEPEGDATPGQTVAPFGVMLTVAIAVMSSLLFGIAPRIIEPLMNAAATVIRP